MRQARDRFEDSEDSSMWDDWTGGTNSNSSNSHDHGRSGDCDDGGDDDSSSEIGTKGLTQNAKKEGFSPAIDNKHAQKWQVGTKRLISTSSSVDNSLLGMFDVF